MPLEHYWSRGLRLPKRRPAMLASGLRPHCRRVFAPRRAPAMHSRIPSFIPLGISATGLAIAGYYWLSQATAELPVYPAWMTSGDFMSFLTYEETSAWLFKYALTVTDASTETHQVFLGNEPQGFFPIEVSWTLA